MKIRSTLLGNLYSQKLRNGLEVQVIELPKFHQTVYSLGVGVGGIDLRWINLLTSHAYEVPPGTAHFLEHLIIEGNDGKTANVFHEIGAEYGGYTTHTSTIYYAVTPNSSNKCLHELLRQVTTYNFIRANVHRESAIINQELQMLENDLEWLSLNNLIKLLYTQHPIKESVIGDTTSLNRIDLDILKTLYDAFYVPSNMVLAVIGPVTFAEVLNASTGFFTKRTLVHPHIMKRIVLEDITPPLCKRDDLNMPQSTALVRIGFKIVTAKTITLTKVQEGLLSEIALSATFGTNTKFFENLLVEGVVHQEFQLGFNVGLGFSFLDLSVETHSSEFLEMKVLDRIRQISQNGLDEGEFHCAKSKFLGRFLMSLDDAEVVSFGLIGSYFRNVEFETIHQEIQALSFELCNEWSQRVFDIRYMATSTIGVS